MITNYIFVAIEISFSKFLSFVIETRFKLLLIIIYIYIHLEYLLTRELFKLPRISSNFSILPLAPLSPRISSPPRREFHPPPFPPSFFLLLLLILDSRAPVSPEGVAGSGAISRRNSSLVRPRIIARANGSFFPASPPRPPTRET